MPLVKLGVCRACGSMGEDVPVTLSGDRALTAVGEPTQLPICWYCENLPRSQRADLSQLARVIVRAMSLPPAKRKRL